MRKAEVRNILEKKYAAYRDEVVRIIKALPPDCRQSGDDLGLEDVWEEFKFQVQREESFTFDLYVETIESLCRDLVKTLPDHERQLLWFDSEGYFDADEDAAPPRGDELIDGLAQELYRRVLELASNEKLTFDPDEERQAAAYQEDFGPFGEPNDEPKS